MSAAQSPIDAPVRATGAALRTIGWLKSDGNVRFLPRIEPENAGGFANSSGDPQGYMFQGNGIYLLPTQTSGNIRLAYQQRPGTLVLPAQCCEVDSVDPTGNTLTVVSRDTTRFASPSAGLPMDLVSSVANYVAYGLDVPASDWDDSVSLVLNVTHAQALAANVGDFVCLAGETCIPQLPPELFPLLAQRTAHVIAQAAGFQRRDAIEKAWMDLEKRLTMLLSPRSDGSARPVISHSRIGRFWYGY